ncbi:hypothetical protein ACFSKU_02880 [Pontibacter silvestris]|uniref:Lipocalin-like domain-containing protein n=2 Tax=Pontibacter silvestris TaxID=2305183 RepID=A0ABW4WT31_9BACT|nr:hypothetical protein [Pontibacter silvestris]
MEDDELSELVTANFVEGNWILTDLIYEEYYDGQLDTGNGEHETPNAPVTMANGKLMSPGETTADYVLTEVDGKDYIVITEEGKDKGTFEITKLTTEEMEWVIEKMGESTRGTYKGVSTYKFTRAE